MIKALLATAMETRETEEKKLALTSHVKSRRRKRKWAEKVGGERPAGVRAVEMAGVMEEAKERVRRKGDGD